MRGHHRILVAFLLASGLGGGAQAAESRVCGAEPPPAGVELRGPVLHVLDGERLCLARGPTPDQWLELRLVDAPVGAARGTLMAAAFAENLDCRVIAAGPGEAVGACALAGESLGRRMQNPQIIEAGAAWR